MSETPTTLAAKLAAVDYRAPDVQMTSTEGLERARRMCAITDCGQPARLSATMCEDCDGETEAMRRYLRAREIYLREMLRGPTWRDRVGVWLANLFHKCWGGLALLVATTFFTIGLCAAEIPAWVLPGILFQESSSRYAAGSIDYVNRDDGKAGEVGPFQMTPAAFDMVKKSGEEFARLKTDMAFAEDCCQRYLRLLYTDFAQRDWFIAVGRWNAGPHGDYGRAWRYAKRVQRAGGGL